MLAIRYLNGPNAGQIYMLKEGIHKFGRSPSCQVQVPSSGISKEHFQIQNENGSLVLVDLNSSNGTFLNGRKVKKAIIKNGDKLGVDKIIFEIVKIVEGRSLVPHGAISNGNGLQNQIVQQIRDSKGLPIQSGQGFHALEQSGASAQMDSGNLTQMNNGHSPQNRGDLKQNIENYLENIVLPGVYQLAAVFEFKAIIFAFSGIFIFLVTFLSLIPMNQITEESIQIESLRRAQTVARSLANSNEKAIRSGEISSYSADLVLKDEGISNVYILGRDGSVMAPPEMTGYVIKDLTGFVQKLKGQTKELAAPIGNEKLAASTPILVYDPELQQNVAKAYAVVVYNPSYLRYDDGRAFSLFIQILVIAVLLGTIIFFFMYKLIERPFNLLNSELNSALSEGRDHAQIEFKFPALQQTVVTINSLLNRVLNSGGGAHAGAHLPESEWINLIQLVGYPALVINKNVQIISLNPAFEQLTGVQFHSVQGQGLQYLPDQALQKNIHALIQASASNTGVIHQDRLEISGNFYSLNCQAISASGEILYYVITVTSAQESSGSAAGGAA